MIDAGCRLAELDEELLAILLQNPSSADFSRALKLILIRKQMISNVDLAQIREAAESGENLLLHLVRARRELAAEWTNLERLRQAAVAQGSISVQG